MEDTTMSNWIKTNIEMPKEGATCLVTTQGDIALAKYSEGYFTQYGNDDVSDPPRISFRASITLGRQ